MNIAFITNENSKIGMGHIMRCLALAEEFARRNDYNILFIMENYEEAIEKIRDFGFNVEAIEKQKNITSTVGILRNFNPDVIITDLYTPNEKLLKELKNLCKILVNIDDFDRINNFSDIIINGNVIFNQPKDLPKEIKYYGGPSYEILRKEFALASKKGKIIRKKCKSVLISFGSSDSKGLIFKVINAIKDVDKTIKFNIIIGLFFDHKKRFDKICSKLPDNFKVFYDVKNMVDFMVNADIAITSFGITSYELAATGTPNIIITQEEKNVRFAKKFEHFGVSIYLGSAEKMTEKKLIENIKKLSNDLKLREKMSNCGKKLVDGMGSERVVNIILEELKNASKI